jgi:hypothetical protein
MPLKSIEEKERKLAPHKSGMNPPMVDPTKTPSQIILLCIDIFYLMYMGGIELLKRTSPALLGLGDRRWRLQG